MGLLLASCKALAKHLKQTSWQKGPRTTWAAAGTRETSAFTPQKLKLLRETLSPPRREKRGSACGRACKALFLITLVAAAAFSGAAAAGSFDSFCLGAAPLPKRGSSRAPMVESRAEAAVGLDAAKPSAQRSIWAAPPWVSVGRA